MLGLMKHQWGLSIDGAIDKIFGMYLFQGENEFEKRLCHFLSKNFSKS